MIFRPPKLTFTPPYIYPGWQEEWEQKQRQVAFAGSTIHYGCGNTVWATGASLLPGPASELIAAEIRARRELRTAFAERTKWGNGAPAEKPPEKPKWFRALWKKSPLPSLSSNPLAVLGRVDESDESDAQK